MELTCEKYTEKTASDKAICRHPTEYCKFRSFCLIHFAAKENAKEESHTDGNKKDEQSTKTQLP